MQKTALTLCASNLTTINCQSEYSCSHLDRRDTSLSYHVTCTLKDCSTWSRSHKANQWNTWFRQIHHCNSGPNWINMLTAYQCCLSDGKGFNKVLNSYRSKPLQLGVVIRLELALWSYRGCQPRRTQCSFSQVVKIDGCQMGRVDSLANDPKVLLSIDIGLSSVSFLIRCNDQTLCILGTWGWYIRLTDHGCNSDASRWNYRDEDRIKWWKSEQTDRSVRLVVLVSYR